MNAVARYESLSDPALKIPTQLPDSFNLINKVPLLSGALEKDKELNFPNCFGT